MQAYSPQAPFCKYLFVFLVRCGLQKSATLIQRRALTWIARRWFKWISYRRWNAALYIQSWYKSTKARIYVLTLRKEYRRHRRAARVIQAAYRGLRGRRLYATTRWAHRRATLMLLYSRVLALRVSGQAIQVCVARVPTYA